MVNLINQVLLLLFLIGYAQAYIILNQTQDLLIIMPNDYFYFHTLYASMAKVNSTCQLCTPDVWCRVTCTELTPNACRVTRACQLTSSNVHNGNFKIQRVQMRHSSPMHRLCWMHLYYTHRRKNRGIFAPPPPATPQYFYWRADALGFRLMRVHSFFIKYISAFVIYRITVLVSIIER